MNIRKIDQSSEAFQLLERTGRSQTASISLECGELTSDDFSVHPHSDQIVLVVEGEILAEVGGEREVLRSRESVIIPAGVQTPPSQPGAKAGIRFHRLRSTCLPRKRPGLIATVS